MSKILDHIVKTGDKAPLMAVDAWAWAHYSKIKLVGGSFATLGAEFQVEMLQSEARRQCIRKATQMCGTEAYVLKTLHGLIYCNFPRGVLYLFPTADDVIDFSTSRFDPLIKDNPVAIGRHIRDTNRANLKRIGRAYLYFRGARLGQVIEKAKKSSTKLKSIPVDMVVFDEVDEMSPTAIDMAKARMARSEIKGEVYLGNPTIPAYGIDAIYEGSDQRIWMIRCRHCNYETCLELEFPTCLKRRVDGSVIRACRKCGQEVFPGDGRWVARYPARSKDMVGWWISHLSSIFIDPKELLDAWENPETNKQEFYNLDLGLAYVAAENKLTLNDIYECCNNEPMSYNHKGPCALGIDVQGEKKGCHVVIGCKSSKRSVKILYMARLSLFNDIHDAAKKFNVRCAVIDQEPETRAAKDFAKKESYPVYLCKYKESQRKAPAFDEKEGLVSVNRTEVCDATHNLVADTETSFILPRRCSEIEEYAKQMCSIVKVLDEDPQTGARKYVYRRTGQDDYRHATNYFHLALSQIGISSDGDSGGFRPKRRHRAVRSRH